MKRVSVINVSTQEQLDAGMHDCLSKRFKHIVINLRDITAPIDLAPHLGPQCSFGCGRLSGFNATTCSGCEWICYDTPPQVIWVTLAGREGKGATPMHPRWARSVRDACTATLTPFYFSGWGSWLPISEVKLAAIPHVERCEQTGILTSGKWGADVTREVCQAEADLPVLMYRADKIWSSRSIEDQEWLQVPRMFGGVG